VVTVTQRKRLPTTENPYAKPTYRSFEWLLPSRRRSSVGSDEASAVKRKRRRNLFDSSASSTTVGQDSVSVNEDFTNSSCADSTVGRLFVDVTGNDVTQGQEPDFNKSPSPGSVEDRKLDDGKVRLDFVSPHKDKSSVCVNRVVSGSDSLMSPTYVNAHEPCSSTPLKRSPLHSSDETPASVHVTNPSSSSPRFDMSKLNSRHFSDILVDRTYPSSTSRTRTVSQNDEDTYIDVVSDTPVTSSTSVHSVNSRRSTRNGFADGLARLSKIKAKKHLAADGLVNGLRQGTLDSFVRRVPNGNRCPNGVDDVIESVAVTENENHDLKHNSPSSVKLKHSAVDRVKADFESSDKNTSDERMGHVDNFVDMDSIEGVWRRRTSLRSSTAFMNLLGPDVADLT